MGANGLIAYLVTPLAADGRHLRLEMLEPYLERLLACCNVGGVACLANDFPYFSHKERRSIASEVIRAVQGRVPVYVCTSGISTLEAVELSKHAEGEGAAKVIINPHGYLTLDDDQILEHYDVISRALRIPIHVYNNPTATKTNMSVGLLRRIVDATGARSIKEAGSSVEKFQELRAEFAEDVVLHVGFHYMAMGGFALGATAWDAGLVPGIAGACERLYLSAVQDRDLASAQRQFQALVPLFQFFRDKGALPSLKAIAEMDGLPLGGVRAPVRMLGGSDVEELRRRLMRATRSEGEAIHG